MMIEYAQYAHPWHPRVRLFRRPRSWRAIASVPRHHGGDDTGGCLLSPPLTPIERGWEAINAASRPRIKAASITGLERNPYQSHALPDQSPQCTLTRAGLAPHTLWTTEGTMSWTVGGIECFGDKGLQGRVIGTSHKGGGK